MADGIAVPPTAGAAVASVRHLSARRSDNGDSMPTTALNCAHHALQRISGFETVVSLCLDGGRMLVAMELDADEHRRRADARVGAITSTALLHGIWLLPAGGAVPAASLPDDKVRNLRAEPYVAQQCGSSLVRTYSPPGVVRAVGFVGRCVERAVLRAARFTPIFQRFVLLDDDDLKVPLRVEWEAREWGVGIVALGRGHHMEHIIPAAEAVVGVPSVYRWWVAELAYRRLLQDSTHPVS